MRLGQNIDLGDWGSLDFNASNKLQSTVNENLVNAFKKLGLDWLIPKDTKQAAAMMPAAKPPLDPRLLIFGVGAGVLLLILALRK